MDNWLEKLTALEKEAKTRSDARNAKHERDRQIVHRILREIIALGYAVASPEGGQISPKTPISRAILNLNQYDGLTSWYTAKNTTIALVPPEQLECLTNPELLAETLYRGWTWQLREGEYTLRIDGDFSTQIEKLCVFEDEGWSNFQELREGLLDV